MSRTIRLLDSDRGEPFELDFPHSMADILSHNYKCIMQISPELVLLFDYEHLEGMSAFESMSLLEHAAKEFELAFLLDTQEGIVVDMKSPCKVLLEWANLYSHGVWAVT